MQTLIQPEVKLKIASSDKSNCQIKKKSNNSISEPESKFYQKLFVILLAFCTFLIFPESPQDAEALCKKYRSQESCMVW